MKIFRYRADKEDSVCQWRSVLDFGFFGINKDVTVDCYGEVWTDEYTNILACLNITNYLGRGKTTKR